MFCKNCGKEIDNLAAVCVHCGVAVGNGVKFCANCGQELPDGAAFCVHCGAAANGSANLNTAANTDAKSKIAAGLLAIFLGSLGVHNFYLGFTKRAVLQLLVTLLTCGIGSTAMGIWALIEGVFYLVGKEGYTADAKGVPLKE